MTTRPASAASGAINAVGFAAALGVFLYGVFRDLPPLYVTLGAIAAYVGPLLVLELLILKVHRRETTGLDWSRPPRPADGARVAIKLLGLAGTLAVSGLAVWLLPLHSEDRAGIIAQVALFLAPAAILAVPYFVAIDRRMREPEDGYFQVGSLLLGRLGRLSREKLRAHALAWTVKGFFLPLMLFYLLVTIAALQKMPLDDLVSIVIWLTVAAIGMELVIVCAGYICTFRLTDSHIRSTNPLVWGWVVTLACYEPFRNFTFDTWLNYRDGLQWHDWFGGIPWLAWIWAGALCAAFGVYLWATVSFGLRWSNLTYRGIITHGPYRWCKHPEYASKCVYFWLVNVPFLSIGGPGESLRACLLLLVINAIYWARAKAEERHLLRDDPDYAAYCAYIAEQGVLARLRQRASGVKGRARFAAAERGAPRS